MQKTRRYDYLSCIFKILAFSVIFSAFVYKADIVADAGVKANDINTYIRTNGDTYLKLTDEEKSGYNKAKESAMYSLGYSRISSEAEWDGYRYYLYDHPAIDNNFSMMTKAQGAAALARANRLANRAQQSTKYAKALCLHDQICESTVYGTIGEPWHGQSAYECLLYGKAVCNGYAHTYKLLCDLRDIPCHVVYGTSANGGRHAWNVNQLDDGEWYEVDVTWDDDDLYYDHMYFGITTQALKHTRQSNHGDKIAALAPVAYGTSLKPVAVENVRFEYPDGYIGSIEVGEVKSVNTIITPVNATYNKTKWFSDDTSVVTVDDNGRVQGIKAGSAYIRVKIDGIGYRFNVTVNQPTKAISVAKKETIKKGTSVNLSNYMKIYSSYYENLQWSSSDNSVAAVSGDGVVSGIREGTAVVRAESLSGTGVYGTFEVVVTDSLPVSKVTISGPSSVYLYDRISLIANITPENAEDKRIIWSSSDTSVADIDPLTGTVDGLNLGQATIKAETVDGSGAVGYFDLRVLSSITGIQISGPDKVVVDNTIELKAAVLPQSASEQRVDWKAANPEILRIDENGIVRGLKAGKSKVYATATDGSNIVGTYEINVYPKIEAITITGPESVNIGEKIKLKANVSPDNALSKSIMWKLDDPSTGVLSIDENGTVTGLKPGGAWVEVCSTDGSYVFEFKWITVTKKLVKKITISGEKSVKVGNSIKLSASISPEKVTNSKLKWTSSNSSVATVDANGKVKAVKAGTVTITVSAMDGSGVNCTYDIVVKNPSVKVKKVTVAGEKVVKVGSRIKLTATVSPKNATNKNVKWSSSKTSIATVNSSGTITAKSAGTVTIKATAKDGSGAACSYKVKVIKKSADPPASKLVKKISSAKVTAKESKKVKVSWKKQSSAIRYEIQIAKDRKFKKSLVTKVAAKGKENLTFQYKKTGNAYVRVRAVDKYGYVGSWSSVKSVKIK